MRVADVVVLKRLPTAVREISVGFDHELRLGPEEVDRVWPDPYVHVGRGDARLAAKREEVAFEV
jgi:hypothetical protein